MNSRAIKICLLSLIIISFFGLRFSGIDQQKDAWDQERDYIYTLDHLEGKQNQYSGPRFGHKIRIPSVVYHWFLSIPLLFSKTMMAMRVFVILVNFFALVMTFYVAKKIFNFEIAFLSIAFMTFSPFSVKYSVFLWNPNFMPFWAILVLYLFWITAKQNNSKYVFFLILVVYMGLSFHALSLSYVLFIVLGWWLFKIKWNKIYTLYGFILVFLFFFLYLYFDWQNDFENLKADIFSPSGKSYGLEVLKSFQWLILFSTNEISSLLEKGFDKNLDFFLFPGWYFWFSMFFFLFSIFISLKSYFFLLSQEYQLARKNWKNYFSQKRIETILLLFLFSAPLFLIIFGRGGVPRYVSINAPVVFLILGYSIYFWMKNLPYRQRIIVIILLTIHFINQAAIYLRLEPFTRLNS